MSKLFRIFPFLLLIGVMSFFPITSVFADGKNDANKKEIDISISPKDVLFAISNMKPGDWAPRTITVKNSGSKDFDYQMHVQNSGEKKLFNELLLEIKAGDKELYQGKLAAFKSLPARTLTSGTEENLDITIRFPEHLGNDFQGLTSAFVFSFTVEGSDNPGDGGSENPGDGGNNNPGDGGSNNPGDGGSENPGDGGSNNPGDGESDNPGDEGSENPGDGESNNPGNGESDNPGDEGSENPGDEENDSSADQVMIKGQIDSGGPTSPGFSLPATSTNIFNLMLVGSILVAGGIVLMIIRHFRRMKLAR
ncbi:hypothetical protein FQ087_12860 [Sporosarcina sp. ANT_H38]|uniref:hypothetical protein n=1 Tax=Sporosarcina sp. ANT_H38 TaxID=2597358 RepID=UPI0011F3DD9B|nr:hypothetical protein [Sporosarcina sp. ANT_H38]KAA0955496.1 hypothetical protein FQ087_12860 [Sporosarcina sp. ANT_H38]